MVKQYDSLTIVGIENMTIPNKRGPVYRPFFPQEPKSHLYDVCLQKKEVFKKYVDEENFYNFDYTLLRLS